MQVLFFLINMQRNVVTVVYSYRALHNSAKIGKGQIASTSMISSAFRLVSSERKADDGLFVGQCCRCIISGIGVGFTF